MRARVYVCVFVYAALTHCAACRMRDTFKPDSQKGEHAHQTRPAGCQKLIKLSLMRVQNVRPCVYFSGRGRQGWLDNLFHPHVIALVHIRPPVEYTQSLCVFFLCCSRKNGAADLPPPAQTKPTMKLCACNEA